jgi:hypothetical protein
MRRLDNLNIENLKEGQVIKNYKALCAELEMEIKSSTNSKNAQYRELERYCNFVRDGHSFIIKEVYKEVKEKVDGRGKSEGSRRSIYGNAVQLLITDLLAKSGGHIDISKTQLMLKIGMINVNYSKCNKHVKKLAKFVNMNEKIIYDFYNINNSNLKGIIERALDNLEDTSVIMYSKIIKIREQGNQKYRKATRLEVARILECEKEALEQLGFEDKSQVRVSSKWNVFQKEVQNKLSKSTTIEFYYSAYDITINQKYITQERNKLAELLLEQVVREETQKSLNSTIIDQFINNSEERKEVSFTAGKMSKVRGNKNYVDNMKKLASLLIDKKAKSIITEVWNVEFDKELPLDILNDIEAQLMGLFS